MKLLPEKCMRLEIMMIVRFLCTRVHYANRDDKCKLEHVLGYSWATQHDKLNYWGFYWCSIGVNYDLMSHTGILILVKGVIIFTTSRKQKCVSKSPKNASKMITGGLSKTLTGQAF